MFDELAAKKDMLQEILKMASEARMKGLKDKFAPAPAAEPTLDETEPGAEVEIKAEGDEADPEMLQKLLEMLGG